MVLNAEFRVHLSQVRCKRSRQSHGFRDLRVLIRLSYSPHRLVSSSLRRAHVKNIEELWIIAMNFGRVDANEGS